MAELFRSRPSLAPYSVGAVCSDPGVAAWCAEPIVLGLGRAAVEPLSELAQFFVNKGEARGRAAGAATGVLAVLEARGIDVPEDVRLRVSECQDLELLDTWMRRAVTARSVADLDG